MSSILPWYLAIGSAVGAAIALAVAGVAEARCAALERRLQSLERDHHALVVEHSNIAVAVGRLWVRTEVDGCRQRRGNGPRPRLFGESSEAGA